MSILQTLTNTTVRIQANTGAVATGFFYMFVTNDERGFIPTLITNRRALVGATELEVALQIKEPHEIEFEEVIFDLNKLAQNIVVHPDESVDLAAVRITPIIKYIEKNGLQSSIHFLDEGILPTPEDTFNAMEDVAVIAYPNSVNELGEHEAFISCGMTTTGIDQSYRGAAKFLVNTTMYPGYAGGPVFTYDRENLANQDICLVGITSDVFRLTEAGLMEEHPIDTMIPATTENQSNMGIMIQATKIRDLETIFKNML
ncbi:trypsin-like peptidase domain-containing protein [Vagococcus intermedius]|uniref:Serine protease n=1 Tax=Vagococcus intermedius TaxID=2991418 RepID=A0AAF0IA15_9ENTE|nr:trypsin-like peptidase domain-containing protein [Vagococcus intermedius]WEG74027.1 serine protease [Vagococcus intermedius]WEG76107.1 serine protease [Vagococcus intermedius]